MKAVQTVRPILTSPFRPGGGIGAKSIGVRRFLPVLLCLTFLLTAGCDPNVRNLGGGFKLVRQSDQGAPHSASVRSHHLYYDSKDLGSVGQCFISPSGCHAVYEQEGKLLLFHSCSEKLKPVADLAGARPAQITWSETRNEARITYSRNRSVTIVPLSPCACVVESRPLSRTKAPAKSSI